LSNLQDKAGKVIVNGAKVELGGGRVKLTSSGKLFETPQKVTNASSESSSSSLSSRKRHAEMMDLLRDRRSNNLSPSQIVEIEVQQDRNCLEYNAKKDELEIKKGELELRKTEMELRLREHELLCLNRECAHELEKKAAEATHALELERLKLEQQKLAAEMQNEWDRMAEQMQKNKADTDLKMMELRLLLEKGKHND